MNKPFHVRANPQAVAHAAAVRMAEWLSTAIEIEGTAKLAISGGSTPKLMFQELAKREDIRWPAVHLYWVDERCVAPSDEQSNYRVALEHLIQPAGIPAQNVHRIEGELSPTHAAADYAERIGGVEFDVVHCGMGDDGHTASLFPGDKDNIEDRELTTAAVFAPKAPNWRVTLLPRALLSAANVMMLVTGGDKAAMLNTVLTGEYNPVRYPAQLLARESKHVEWFLDEAAAAQTARV
jgi:6-phosphogluconolactonase